MSAPVLDHSHATLEDPAVDDPTDETAPDQSSFGNSGLMIPARYLADLPAMALGLAGTLLWISTWDQPWRTLFQVLVGLWVASLILGPWIRWATVRFTVSTQGVQVDSGLIFRRSEFLPWDLVTSIDDRQPWNLRMFGLTEVVCAQTGEDGSRVTLEALRPEQVEVLRRLSERSTGAHHLGAPAPQAERPAPEPVIEPDSHGQTATEERLVYRTTVRDLLLMSLIYGQVLVLVPPLAFGLLEVAELFGLSRALEDSLVSGLGSWPTAVLIVLIAVGAGLAATVLKYHDFTVHALPGGRLRIRYGLLSTHQRLISPGAVQGVVWQRNAVEQLTGRVRLSALTLDSSSQLGGNLVLPSVPRAVAEHIVTEHLPDFAASSTALSRGRSPLVLNLLVAIVMAIAVVSTWQLLVLDWGWGLWWAVPVCMLVLMVSGWILGVLTARFGADRTAGLFTSRRVLLSEQVMVVRASRLHAVTALHGPGATRRSRPAWIPTVHCFAGSPTRRTALRTTPEVLGQIQEMVRHDSVPLRA